MAGVLAGLSGGCDRCGQPGAWRRHFINSGLNLISNGGSPARAVVGGDDYALNFTGVKIPNGGASFLSIYDTTPGDDALSNLFSANGGLEISADVLFAPGRHAASAGVVALYGGGQDGLALLASNGGGNNPDVPKLSLVFRQSGAPTTLASTSLTHGNFLGDTNGMIATGASSGDHWYRVVLRLSTIGDAWAATGSFYNHTDATNPNSSLGALITSLSFSGSLTSPGNALDLTNPGEIGVMAFTPGPLGDGVSNNGGTPPTRSSTTSASASPTSPSPRWRFPNPRPGR